MTIDKFKRVIWRLREMKPKDDGNYTNKQVRLAIMEEIGTDERTISVTISKLTELKMLTHAGFGRIKIGEGVE